MVSHRRPARSKREKNRSIRSNRLAALLGTAGAWLTPLPAGLAAPGAGPVSGQPTPAAATAVNGTLDPQGPAPRPTDPGSAGRTPGAAGTSRSPAPTAASPPLELELSADSQRYDAELGRYVATGQVKALLAGGRIMADRIEFDPTSRQLLASGSVRFQRGQQYFQASRLRFSLLEGRGEMEDVYGVLDLDGSQQDLDLTQLPSAPLPPPQPISCSPSLPPLPDWHPFPWSVTAWGGQMYTANFGDTFLFNGQYRPEYLAGVGMQRRILDGGLVAFELDANLLNHRSQSQPGGGFNQEVPFANTPAQSFGDGTLGLGMRFWLQPWLNIYFVQGVSLLTEPSNYEKTFRDQYSTFLNYLAFEVEALFTPRLSAVGRIHHRSGAYGTYNGVSEGSNGYLLGLRYRFGTSAPPRKPPELPPAQGCPGAPPPESNPPTDLASQLDLVTMGPAAGDPAPSNRRSGGTAAANPSPAPGEGTLGQAGSAVTPPAPAARPTGTVWDRARIQERERATVIAGLNQRVTDVQFQQSLSAERRYGFPSTLSTPDQVNEFGGARPNQLNNLATQGNSQLVKGTISRWRVQARQMAFTTTTITADRMAFSNDPFTPAQSWMDSENVVATLLPNGDTEIRTDRNRLVLDERLPIPITRRTVIKKQQDVDNRWVLGVDEEDRNGRFIGYNIPVRVGETGILRIQPQFLTQRAINGDTDSYPLPGQSANAAGVSQPTKAGDLFGLQAVLRREVLGFNSDATLEMSTFNPDNIANGTRSWGDFSRAVKMPLLGESKWRLFGAYRFRTWNGTLGEQDVYSAYGTSLEQTGLLPNWGKLSGNYLWRTGVGNFQGNDFTTNNLADSWRFSGIGSANLNYPLWIGKPAALTASAAYANTGQPVVPGLWLRANVLGTFAYYGNGVNQNTIGLTGGPTLTLGHFVKPFFDYTEITVTGGGTLRQGGSPFSFDRAVDLGTIGIGLSQQIAGPLVFSGGIGYNVDPNSPNYGEITNSYLEFRWQRRSYEIGIFYSPYDGLGGLRVKLNDFNFGGTGLPFVPYSRQVAKPGELGPKPSFGPDPAIGPAQGPINRPF